MIGTGGGIVNTTGGTGEIVLTEVAHWDDLTRATVAAMEDADGTRRVVGAPRARHLHLAVTRALAALSLSIVVSAGPRGSASAAVIGLELVEAVAIEQSATATCPAGKRVVGAGGEMESDAVGGQVTFRNIRPRADLSGVDVQGLEDEDGAAGGWRPRMPTPSARHRRRGSSGSTSPARARRRTRA